MTQRRLREAALPLMAELPQSLRQVMQLGLLDAGTVLQIEEALPRTHRGALASLGSRRPAHASALEDMVVDLRARLGVAVLLCWSLTTLMRLSISLTVLSCCPETGRSGRGHRLIPSPARIVGRVAVEGLGILGTDAEFLCAGQVGAENPMAGGAGSRRIVVSRTDPADRGEEAEVSTAQRPDDTAGPARPAELAETAGSARPTDRVDPVDVADPAPMGAPGTAPYFVKSLARGIAVMRVFGRDRPEITRSEAAEATGLSRAAARRFLLTLADLSYVRSDGRNFRLTPGVLRLGYAYLSSHPLVRVAQNHCDTLALDARETTCAWVLDGVDAVCVVHVPAARIMAVSVNVGTRSPAKQTAAGRVLLDAQADGNQSWAIVDDDPQNGFRTIAVPVHDAAGRCVAAVGLLTHASRTSAAALRRGLLPSLLEAGHRIETDLDTRPVAAGRQAGGRRRADEAASAGAIIATHPGAARGAHFVQSLDRGLAVILAFIAGPPQLTLSEVGRATGLTRAAARRFLLTLRDLGYIRADAGHFELTPQVLELGYAYLSGLSLPDVAEPRLEQFVAEVGESSAVAILDGHAIVYLVRVAAAKLGALSVSVGTRMPAWATAMGRVLLAQLPAGPLDSHLTGLELRPLARQTITSKTRLRDEIERARDQGWALVDGELEDGLRSLAVPIRSWNGDVVAAVGVSMVADSGPAEAMRRRLLPPLLNTARLIEADLRVAGSPSTHRPAAGSDRGAASGCGHLTPGAARPSASIRAHRGTPRHAHGPRHARQRLLDDG